jgi:hypothetical protein
MANGIPTIPDPTMALIKFAVAPTIDDLFSLTVSLIENDLVCFDPPGVSVTLVLIAMTRGVEGAKKGDLSTFDVAAAAAPAFLILELTLGFPFDFAFDNIAFPDALVFALALAFAFALAKAFVLMIIEMIV